jgi:diaminopimelate epimerase
MSDLPFVKGHGTQNDFVVLPDPDGALDLTPGLVAALCDRRAGVGADGVLRVVRTAKVADSPVDAADAEWFMDYRNADGSVAEMCGNGVRVYARYLVDAGLAPAGRLALATHGGVKVVDLGESGDVTVDMGPPELPPYGDVPVVLDGETRPGRAVSMGNPHVVVLGDEPVDGVDLTRQPGFPAALFPTGVNVEVVQRAGEGHLVMRVHERGVGETRSCGTGVCAAVVAAALNRWPGSATPAPSRWTVDVPGGRLATQIVERPDGTVTVRMTGPAVLVAEGVLRAGWLEDASAG